MDLEQSSYWRRMENELKRRCKLGNDVFIYQIGNESRSSRSLNGKNRIYQTGGGVDEIFKDNCRKKEDS